MAPTGPPSPDPALIPAHLIGRDELNFAEFPIGLLADRVPQGQKTLYFQDQHGRLTVTGSDAYGLPTATDTDVIVALLYLTKLRNDFRDVKVPFSRYELVKLLNWPFEGGSYRRLELSFNRWGGVWLVYDKCWWDNKLKKYVSAKMHIIESVAIAESGGRNRKVQNDSKLSSFTWNRAFIESCQADNLRQLDLDTYFSLPSAVAKRLYRFLGKRFYLQRDWVFDLDEIAFDRVGLSRGYEGNAGKIKEKLQPALEELEAIGFLQPLSRADRYQRVDRGRWTIRLVRPASGPGGAAARPKAIEGPPPGPPAALLVPSSLEPEPPALVPEAARAAPSGPAPEPAGLVLELTRRGVTRATAETLVRQHPAQRIEAKLDVFDWLRENQDPRVGKSPAGYLVKSIREDYAAPEGYVSPAERRRREEARQAHERAAAEAHRRRQAEAADAAAERAVLEAYWASLTPAQQAALDAAALAQADPELQALETGPLKQAGRRLRRDQYLRRLLQDQGRLPRAED